MEILFVFAAAIFVLIWYVRLGKSAVNSMFAATVDANVLKRALLRSFVAAAFFGLGFIGTEGFAIVAPALYAFWVSLLIGTSTAWTSAVGFAVSWGILLVVFLVRDIVAARTGRPPMLAPKWPLPIFFGIVLAVVAAIPVGSAGIGYLLGRIPVDVHDVKGALLQYSESLPETVASRWRQTGELICETDELIASLPKAVPTDFHMEYRVKHCEKYVVNVIGRTQKRLGGIYFSAEIVEADESTYLKWTCSMATFVKGESSSIYFRCADTPLTPVDSAAATD